MSATPNESMSAPSVFVLVLNYCSLEDTLACTESLSQETYHNLHVLVLDNASPDGSGPVLAEKLGFGEFVQLPQNTGYAGGNNAGMAIALERGADYIFIVNPDVRVTPGSVAAYVQFMEAHPEVWALNPIQLGPDGETLDELFAREIFDGNHHPRPTLPAAQGESWEVKSLFGAALFLRRSTIERVGGFDPLYFAYWEEMDLCRRIRYHQGRLAVVGTHPVLHLRSYQDESVNKMRSFLRLKGMYLYYLKCPNLAFSRSVKKVFKQLFADLFTGRREFGNSTAGYLKTLVWLLRHLQQIRMHRRGDHQGRSYL